MSLTDKQKEILHAQPKNWLVTGVAGFIGSHLAEVLLSLNQKVTGLDDMSSGSSANLARLENKNFKFIEGDIRDMDNCLKACDGAHIILHHAAIASVVKSVQEPELVADVNVEGFRILLSAAEKRGVKRCVFASSSAVYGDASEKPRHEDEKPTPKSPYAQTKCDNERAAAKSRLECVGFRYFNIYGLHQDPCGAYAAVIPKWIEILQKGGQPEIYGDGKTVRDFCFIDDVITANILAATTSDKSAINDIYNIGSGTGVQLNELLAMLCDIIGTDIKPIYKDFREADIRLSQADISKAKNKLGFDPSTDLRGNLEKIIRDTS